MSGGGARICACAAQRKYEEKHEKAEVRADEEMDVGV
jgi:hypothetical protein